MTSRPSRWSAVHRSAVTCLVAASLGACGAAPAVRAVDEPAASARNARRDVLREVFLRGAPAEASGGPRAALTVEGLDACSAGLLARAAQPAPGARPLRLTFFLSAGDVAAARAASESGAREAIARLRTDGHEVALRVERAPLEGEVDARGFRALLAVEAAALRTALVDAGWPEVPEPRAWRGPPERGLFDRSGFTDRPLVLWSVHPPDPASTSADAYVADLVASVRDADILRWASAEGHCGLLESVGSTSTALDRAGVRASTLSEVLGPFATRRSSVRLLRFASETAAPCETAPSGDAGPSERGLTARWGLVVDVPAGERAVVVPLAERGTVATRLVEAPAWPSVEAASVAPLHCRVEVPQARWLSPLASDRAVWITGRGRPARRDARALAPTTTPLALPTLADLVRLESKQRLPWRLRGIVARALGGLGLSTPLLLETRTSVGVVVGRMVTPAALEAPTGELAGAIAGYVQWNETSLGEYLVLAEARPADADALTRSAYAFDGALRAGPFLVIDRRGGGAATIDPVLLPGPGAPAFGRPATALLADVLRTGASLAPGDVVVVAPAPLEPAALEPVMDDEVAPPGRAGLRHTVARALLAAAERDRWLRPGAPVESRADTLGLLAFRLVLPAGVAVPDLRALRAARPALDPVGVP